MSIPRGLYASKDMVLLNYKANDRKEILEKLGELVLQKDYISQDFIKSVIQREEEFPTGLEMQIPIAIPHIGTDCSRSFLSMAILQEPVTFLAMDGTGKELKVEIVFMFGITNPEQQVQVLKKFIFAFREKENLEKLKEAEDSETALQVLNALLDNCLIIC